MLPPGRKGLLVGGCRRVAGVTGGPAVPGARVADVGGGPVAARCRGDGAVSTGLVRGGTLRGQDGESETAGRCSRETKRNSTAPAAARAPLPLLPGSASASDQEAPLPPRLGAGPAYLEPEPPGREISPQPRAGSPRFYAGKMGAGRGGAGRPASPGQAPASRAAATVPCGQGGRCASAERARAEVAEGRRSRLGPRGAAPQPAPEATLGGPSVYCPG